MRFAIPHPVPYQGSKRRLAAAILSQIPPNHCKRLVEPFAGSAAVTLAAASRRLFSNYLIGDVLKPLSQLWQSVIDNPQETAREYERLWLYERANPIAAYYEIRSEFNEDRNSTKLLYLLARCVKNAVRFNPSGQFNQSPDKRRKGTHPSTMRSELFAAHRLLTGKSQSISTDFMTLIQEAQEDDFFYLDPPYQGTSEGRDLRYVAGVRRERILEALAILNERRTPYVLSYDGFCGSRRYGEPLPTEVAHRILLDVGRSSQATLNGNHEITVESLYVSHTIANGQKVARRSLEDFREQAGLFALTT
jgi:DNA adenine methylase